MKRLLRCLTGVLLFQSAWAAPLPGTDPLDELPPADRSIAMVQGIGKFLDGQAEKAIAERPARWARDFSGREAYEKSVQPQRERLAKIIGAVEPRVLPVEMRLDFTTDHTSLLARNADVNINAVSWPVVAGISAEGILVSPALETLRAGIVLVPDADESPAQFVSTHLDLLERLLAEGCQVLVPMLVNREVTLSGNESIDRWTNQPHREWLYRQGFDLGRHLIGYEVQEILAAVDWFESRLPAPAAIGCIGYGEGGLLALYAAALDSRIDATLVSGYFAPRKDLWREPIYRNLFGFARDFGDAELATLIAPRGLIIEHAVVPTISGPPFLGDRIPCAAPGVWSTPNDALVAREFERTLSLLAEAPEDWRRPALVTDPGGTPVNFASEAAVTGFLERLPIAEPERRDLELPRLAFESFYDSARIHARNVRQIEAHLQDVLRKVGPERDRSFWPQLAADPDKARAEFTRQFKQDVMGWFDDPRLPLRSRSRELRREAKWTAHEVTLDVWPEVFAWGYLLVPNDLKPGEKRPVVVCQHGLEGLPGDVIERDESAKAWSYYKGFGAQLADRGYIVFAPHNPYRGGNAFRDLQRKANPLGRSLFSVIGRQHEAIVDWLVAQPFVDPARIGFYGLSYGGKSAMRLPILEPRYALSICSGDFNEWVWKNATIDWRGSYVYAPEHEIFEWDLGHTFNYAEMAALIAPRPFMVERGHRDGVGLDEWVAFEYAKVRRCYADLKIPERTEIEWFDGPHTINGVGSFAFLERWLGTPK